MKNLGRKLLDELLEDTLLLRVMVFNMGLALVALVSIAVGSGTLIEVNDGSFYIVIAMMLAAGLTLIREGLRDNEKRLANIFAALAPDITIALALLTLSAPITLAIKRWKNDHKRADHSPRNSA